MLRVYGIKNCDTVKKALRWLDDHQQDYEFVDFKKKSPSSSELKTWKKAYGDWPVNKKGRTFKTIKEDFEAADEQGKVALMQEKTSAIKRPIVMSGNDVLTFGFSEEEFEEKLS